VFTIDDLWRIMKYLKDGTTDPYLSELTTTLATSEKELVITFFEQVLDQQVFNSDDYRRLREMFIDWYSSHKTIATTQKYASDVHQLPNNHLSELFKSFGFPHGLNLVPLTSKANFFLDLVNFYKKKGTPETLVDVLDYYGFSDTDLIEYWLQKDQYGNIIFRGESVRLAATGSTVLLDSDVPFNKLTNPDPHWLQSLGKIESLIETNKICLPSKSPYFSLSSIFSLYNIIISLSILFRVVEDQYDRAALGLEIPYNVPVKNIGIILPILHIYVGTVYTFEKLFGSGVLTSFEQYNCYSGLVDYIGDPPIPHNLSNITSIYEELIKNPISRDDRTNRIETLINDWSKPMSQNFLDSINASEPFLEALNPEFKLNIDTWFASGNESYLITYLIGTLDNWIRLNIDSKSPSLVITMLGLGFRDELKNIINFFKPYRARLAFMDTAFSIKNPLTESIVLDQWLLTEIQQSEHDHIRPPGGYCLEMSNKAKEDALIDLKQLMSSTWSWDTGRHFDEPPVIPTLPPEPSLFPPTLCNNPEWIYDIAKKYDIPMPPEYLNFSYDSGGYYDILPYLQKCLMELIKNHPEGGMCDSVEYKIGLTFIDYICPTNYFDSDWDTGASFDSPEIVQWADRCNVSPEPITNDTFLIADDTKDKVIKVRLYKDFDSGGTFDQWYEEKLITIPSSPINEVGQNVRDTFGETHPTQMDVGQSFDTMIPKAVVRDSFSVSISYVGNVHISSTFGGFPQIFDVGGIFDTLANLDVVNDDRIIEWLSSTLTITTNVNSINILVGHTELLESSIDVISLVNGSLFLGEPVFISSTISISDQIYSVLTLGDEQTITGTVLTESIISSPRLLLGLDTDLSSSINISSVVIPNLTRGMIELISSAIVTFPKYGEPFKFIDTDDVKWGISYEEWYSRPILTTGVEEYMSATSFVTSHSFCDLITVGSLYSARSIIVDIENNHGDIDSMALMGIRFSKFGSVIDVGLPGTNYNAYATTTLTSGSYAPWKLFYKTSPLTGTVENWMSDTGEVTNQRVVFNIGAGIDFNEILFYNYHASGTDTDKGVEFVKVYTSTDIITNNNFEGPISNGLLLYDGSIDEHSSVNEEDPQSITIGVYSGSSNTTTNIPDVELEVDVMSAVVHISTTINSNLVTGDPEELSSTINISSNVDGDISFSSEESLSGYVELKTDITSTLSVPNITMSGNCNVSSDINIDLTQGMVEELNSSINLTSMTSGQLILGDLEMFSSSNATTTLIIADLYVGDSESFSSSIDIFTNVDGIINIGLVELLSNTIISITDITAGLLLTGVNEILNGTLDINSSFTAALDMGTITLLEGTSSINSNSDSIIVTGDNEELSSNINIDVNVDVTLSQNDTILTSTSSSISLISDILIIGTSEILEGTSLETINVDGTIEIRNSILEANCIIMSDITPLLSLGVIEVNSSVSDIYTTVDGLLIVGYNEILSASTNITIDTISVLDLGVDEELTGTVSIISLATPYLMLGEIDELTSTVNVSSMTLSTLLSGENEILTSTSNVSILVNSNITTGVYEPLANTRINITTNVSDVLLITGDPEELTSTIDIITSSTSMLVLGENEILVGISNSIATSSSLLTVGFASTSNITTNVSDVLLITGDPEELTSTIDITTSSISMLVLGENEILVGISNLAIFSNAILTIGFSSTSNIISESNANLVTGDPEELTSTIDITTSSISMLVLGENEILSGSSNTTTDINSLLNIEFELTSSINVTSNIISNIVFVEIEELSGTIGINSIGHATILVTGVDEELSSTINTTTEVDGSYILVPENEILSGVINTTTDITTNFVVGEIEELSGSSNSITFIFTSTIDIS
jgi:hypothetical protein